jgi:dGTPase
MNQMVRPQKEQLGVHYGASLLPGERCPALYAANALPSRGRVFDETACPTRSPWQRDRDRVLHSASFRRLMYKTQVFVFHEGDHFRTRLTHTLEVAQIARTIARQLCLDEDLAETLALAHDLGHPPFGHAGERVLDEILAPIGGFDHNLQSFRIVTQMEARYADFDGLNLTWESLEGLIKHNGPPAALERPEDARVVRALERFQTGMDLELACYASAEAQVAAVADDIAWHSHDIDDGLQAGLIEPIDLQDVRLLRDVMSGLGLRPSGDKSRDTYELVRILITRLIFDVVQESRLRLSRLEPQSPDDIRGCGSQIVGFSADMFGLLKELRAFLFERLYYHERVVGVMEHAQGVVRELVGAFANDRTLMPDEWADKVTKVDNDRRLRIVGDFVAGMTDRYAIEQHRLLFDVTPELR